jgi:hypothetical protein
VIPALYQKRLFIVAKDNPCVVNLLLLNISITIWHYQSIIITSKDRHVRDKKYQLNVVFTVPKYRLAEQIETKSALSLWFALPTKHTRELSNY